MFRIKTCLTIFNHRIKTYLTIGLSENNKNEKKVWFLFPLLLTNLCCTHTLTYSLIHTPYTNQPYVHTYIHTYINDTNNNAYTHPPTHKHTTNTTHATLYTHDTKPHHTTPYHNTHRHTHTHIHSLTHIHNTLTRSQTYKYTLTHFWA